MRKKLKYTHSRGIKSGNLHVLRGSLMPAVLIEIGFLSNRSESKKLKNSTYQNQLAEAIVLGIKNFIGSPIPTVFRH